MQFVNVNALDQRVDIDLFDEGLNIYLFDNTLDVDSPHDRGYNGVRQPPR
ncbi:MAG: hypothetical protein V9F03_03470 [Microthrixaceae bacterium]